MRGVLLAVLLAACGGHATTGPAWPKSAVTAVDPDKPEDDGGESLEPRHTEAVASVEASDSAEPDAPAVDLPAAATTDPSPDPAAPPSTTPTVDDPPLEEIVIEVNGD